jgi:receptor protein-tyrosine kinase
MSLIEEAAKRLEQLRSAGVDVGRIGDSLEGEGGRRAEVPESVLQSLEAKVQAAKPAERASEASPTVRSRLVNVDLAKLRAAGFITPDEPTTQIATEFRVIKRPLLDNVEGRSAAPVENANLIMITSAVPGEGKTFTSINLAMSMALELNRTVLLVDADATRSSVMAQLGVSESRGLTDLLLDPGLDLSDVLLRTNVEKLSLLPAGSPYARATELLASDGMMRLVEELATRYPDRLVIFDAPPLLATTESRVLARHMGQIVMVVEADKTTHSALADAMETIKSCPVVSMVLNKMRRSEMGAYYGGYYYRASNASRR